MFGQIHHQDIEDVERFIRDDLFQIVQDKCQRENLAYDLIQVHFFGSYTAETTEFMFSDDDKLLIRRIINYCNDIMKSQGLDKAMSYFEISNDAVIQTPFDWFFCDKLEPTICDKEGQHLIATYQSFEEQSFVFETDKITQTRHILEKLLCTVNKNASKPKEGWRYDKEIQNWASYLRVRAGPLAYTDLQRNLEGALPSLSTTNRYIKRTNTSVIEGVLRSHELLMYLQDRNLPLCVALSEDATRIEGRIQ